MSGAGPTWRLALPMYNLTPAVGRLWEEVLGAVIQGLRSRGWNETLQIVPPPDDLVAFWRTPDLLLSQTCGYPLATMLGDAVRVLAVPEFALAGCAGASYRSVIVVADRGATSLEALRGQVAAVNQQHSHSGMNALRHSIAPLARAGRFFSRVVASGSHLASLALLRRGEADVAAIDCVTWGLVQRHAPHTGAGLRVLQYTHAAPGLPLIASRRLSDVQVQVLLDVLRTLPAQSAAVLERLCVRGFHAAALSDYRVITEQAQAAIDQGYPVVA